MQDLAEFFVNQGRSLVCAPFRIAIFIAVLSSVVRADIVPPGVYPYDSSYADINAPVVGIAGFNGANFFTPGVGVPIDTLSVSLSLGLFSQQYPNTVFSIDSGFAEVSTIVADTNGSTTIDFGDSVFTTIGSGAFSFRQAGILVLGGTFTGGTFTAQIGGASGATISSDTGGLDLFPGPAFDFDNGTYVSQILDPEGFAINLTSIPAPGVQAAPLFGFGGFFVADLLPFGLSNGSVTTSGVAIVVPEPSGCVLLLGMLPMIAWRVRRRIRGQH